MPKTRDVLVHVSVDTAVRVRKCHRSSKHKIEAGRKHLLIRNDGGLGSKNYCLECAREILTGANTRLVEINRSLNN